MKRLLPIIGISGAVLSVGGLVAYSLAPEELWLVTLCEVLGLTCLIAFFVAHFETVKRFSTRRSTRLGFNSILMVSLFAAILVILNFLAARHSVRWDLSETQRFTLAAQTHEVLRGLAQDVKITVFVKGTGQAFDTYRDLLGSYRQASPRLTVEFIDPERRPAVTRQYGITRPNTAVLESGSRSTRVTVPSEAELTAALLRISKDTKKRVVFLDGHGERNIHSETREGYSLATDALVHQGYEVDTLTLLQESRVPSQVSVLVIAGPSRTITEAEQKRIADYVAGGGRLLILLDPQSRAHIDGLLGQWGVEAGKGALVDMQDRLAQGDLTSLMVRTFTEHEITQDLNELSIPVLFPVSRHLTFDEENGKAWNFVPLARTSTRSWAETDIEALNSRVISFNEGEDVRGPLPFAAVLTPKEVAEDGKPQAAVVVVGNSAFASNVYVNFPGNTDFLLHTVAWLAEEHELLSITPKDPGFRPFVASPTQQRILLYTQVLLLPGVTFLWGMHVWRKRRRL